ncbi:O-antigen ligase family protein [Candidatus Kaiserbacteria bacterium]|nr:O-antigen ligase family protein [Candidatus Kaiserbacteria bacterium]
MGGLDSLFYLYWHPLFFNDTVSTMNFENIMRKFVTWGILLVPFIPLIVLTFLFFPFITGKNFAFRILIELLFGGWVILALYNKAYRPRFSWLLGSIVAFVGVIAVADIFGENPAKSIWSNFERMDGLVTLVHLLLYFLVATTVLNTEKLWTRFLNTSVAVSGFLGIYGLFQLWGFLTIHQGGVRLDATFGNATYLAIYMLFHVFITVLLLSRFSGNRIIRHIYMGLIALQILMIYFTATRGAILGFLGGVILTSTLVALFGGKQKVLRKTAAGALVLVFVIVGGFFLIKDTNMVKKSPVLTRFTDLSISSGSTNARFLVWDTALKGIKERPLLGWGQENFNFVFNKYYDPKLYAQEQWFDRVHNIVFDWLIAGGILGFLAYVFMFLATLWYTWHKRNTYFSSVEKSVITGLLAAYTFHNMFVFDNLMSYILFFTIMAYVHWSYKESTKKVFMDNMEDNRDLGIITRFYAPLIILLTLFSMYAVNGKAILASASLLDAISIPAGHPSQIPLFEKAISYNTYGGQEVREQLAQIATRVAGSELSVEIKQQYFSLAGKEMQKQVEKVSGDARTQIFTGTLFDAFSQYSQGQTYIEHANELSPQKPTILFQLGLNTLNRGDVQGALQIFKQAYDLAPQYDQAQIFYAVGAIYAKDDILLKEILVPTYGSIVVDNDRLLQAYLNSGRLQEVLGVLRLRVEKNPNNPQTHLSLAAVYLELNERGNSIFEIQNAIELDPNFKQQGEYFIQEVRAGRNP